MLPSKLVKLYLDGMVSPDDPQDQAQPDRAARRPGAAGPRNRRAGTHPEEQQGDLLARFRRPGRRSLLAPPGDRGAEVGREPASWPSPIPRTDKIMGHDRTGPESMLVDGTAGLRARARSGSMPPDDWAPVQARPVFTKIDPEADKPRHWLKMEFTATRRRAARPSSTSSTCSSTASRRPPCRPSRENSSAWGPANRSSRSSWPIAPSTRTREARETRIDHLELTVAGKTWTLVEEMGTAAE